MSRELIHRFEQDGKRFAIDPETCFCFECDAISWDVLDLYPQTPVNRVYHLLGAQYDPKELAEVVGELEWLRSTKSILNVRSLEELVKQFDVERGLKRVTIRLGEPGQEGPTPRRGWLRQPSLVASERQRAVGVAATELLFARAGDQKTVHLEFVEDGAAANVELIAECCALALKMARLAGKKAVAAVRLADVKLGKSVAALDGHTLAVALEFEDPADVLLHLRALARSSLDTLPRLAKALHPDAPSVNGRVIVRPDHPGFGDVVKVLDEAGFFSIELDLDGAYVANPELDPQRMLAGLSACAHYYANRLLEHHYFRVDPIAALFQRVYHGSPQRRTDPVGTSELAVDETGAIFPSAHWLGREEFHVGSVIEATVDEDKLAPFDNMGSVTTAGCGDCWVRNLCGGGTAAVHHALTGSFRTPHLPWCDAQRAWMAAAVGAFNVLSSAGVNFTRVYQSLGRSAKPSLFALARAAFRMSVGMRPIEESDAEMLTRWENWNEAAYFLCNEKGILLATQYDREIDALHPQGIDHELLLLRKNGHPFGLVKIRPDKVPGAAEAWVYMRGDADYGSDAVRRSLRTILKEASTQQAIQRLTVPVTKRERPLAEFLQALGFAKVGTLREALYLHGAYEDIDTYAVRTDRF